MLSDLNYAELVKAISAPIHQNDIPKERFNCLIDLKYIAASKFESRNLGGVINIYASEWIITALGLDALNEFEQAHNQTSKNERQKRFENKIAVLNVLVPLITFFFGLLLQYFSNIIGLVIDLFS